MNKTWNTTQGRIKKHKDLTRVTWPIYEHHLVIECVHCYCLVNSQDHATTWLFICMLKTECSIGKNGCVGFLKRLFFKNFCDHLLVCVKPKILVFIGYGYVWWWVINHHILMQTFEVNILCNKGMVFLMFGYR